MSGSNAISAVTAFCSVSVGLDRRQKTGGGYSFRPASCKNAACATRLSFVSSSSLVSTSRGNAISGSARQPPLRAGLDSFGVWGGYLSQGEAARTWVLSVDAAAKIDRPRWTMQRRAFSGSELAIAAFHDRRKSTLEFVLCYSPFSRVQRDSRGKRQGFSIVNSLQADSVYGSEEQRSLREEQRWLRAEKRWLREEEKWEREEARLTAANQALQEEVNSLKTSMYEREAQRWFREEQRWLREEQKWERQASLLTAANQALQEEVESLKNSMYERDEQKWQREEQRWQREEQRWQREEKRWLREEQKWEREEARWTAAYKAVQEEVNSLKKELEQLRAQNGYDGEITDISLRNLAVEMRNLLNALPSSEEPLPQSPDMVKQIRGSVLRSGGRLTTNVVGESESTVSRVTFVAFPDKVIAVVTPNSNSPVHFVAYGDNVIAVVDPQTASGSSAEPKSPNPTPNPPDSSQFASRASNNSSRTVEGSRK